MLGGPEELRSSGSASLTSPRAVATRSRLTTQVGNMPAIVLDSDQRERTYTGWDLPNYDAIVSRAPSRKQLELGTGFGSR